MVAASRGTRPPVHGQRAGASSVLSEIPINCALKSSRKREGREGFMATVPLGFPQEILGCIVAGNVDKQRRPYHRYCSCALHEKSRSKSKISSCSASYPICQRICRWGSLVAEAQPSAFRAGIVSRSMAVELSKDRETPSRLWS